MSTAWTCSRCRVTVTFPPGNPEPARPIGWAQHETGWLCLGCRRDEVAQAALIGNEAGRSARRRWALTEFELIRDPDASDQLIAKRVRCTTASVRPVRAALREAGEHPSYTSCDGSNASP